MLAAPPSVGPTLDHRTAGYKRVIYRVRRGHPLATLALRLHGLPDAARGSLPGESADQHPRTARPRALMIKPLTGVGAENGARADRRGRPGPGGHVHAVLPALRTAGWGAGAGRLAAHGRGEPAARVPARDRLWEPAGRRADRGLGAPGTDRPVRRGRPA